MEGKASRRGQVNLKNVRVIWGSSETPVKE